MVQIPCASTRCLWGRLKKKKVWNTDAVAACRRFLVRVFDLVAATDRHSDETDEEVMRITHRLIAKVGSDIDNLMFNTSIAKMMEYVNEVSRHDKYSRWSLKIFVQLFIALCTSCCRRALENPRPKRRAFLHALPKL